MGGSRAARSMHAGWRSRVPVLTALLRTRHWAAGRNACCVMHLCGCACAANAQPGGRMSTGRSAQRHDSQGEDRQAIVERSSPETPAPRLPAEGAGRSLTTARISRVDRTDPRSTLAARRRYTRQRPAGPGGVVVRRMVPPSASSGLAFQAQAAVCASEGLFSYSCFRVASSMLSGSPRRLITDRRWISEWINQTSRGWTRRGIAESLRATRAAVP